MKKIIAILIIIILAGVITAVAMNWQSANTNVVRGSDYGQSLTLQEGQGVTMPDGLTITLRTINDSRCKPGVQCIWAGELAGHFYVTGGALGQNAYELILGASTNPNALVGAYQFTLQPSDDSKALSIIVIKG